MSPIAVASSKEHQAVVSLLLSHPNIIDDRQGNIKYYSKSILRRVVEIESLKFHFHIPLLGSCRQGLPLGSLSLCAIPETPNKIGGTIKSKLYHKNKKQLLLF